MYTIVSLVPVPIREEKPGLYPSRFEIPPCEGPIPQLLHLPEAYYFVYLDEKRPSLRISVPPSQLAASFVTDYCEAQLGITDEAGPGIFALEGKLSLTEVFMKKEQLKEARERQTRWFTNICRIADDDWNKFHQHNVISNFQRVAANYLGWDSSQHEWMTPPKTQTSACPACTTKVPSGAIVCASCRCILDAEAYKKLTFAIQ